MYVAHSLETGWESQFNNKKSGCGSNTSSTINSGRGTNITSNDGNACTQNPPYILPTSQLFDTS